MKFTQAMHRDIIRHRTLARKKGNKTHPNDMVELPIFWKGQEFAYSHVLRIIEMANRPKAKRSKFSKIHL